MVYKPDPVETLIRQNCASIVARYTAPSTALNLAPSTAAGGRRNLFSPLTGGFKCKICGKAFATFQALGGHVSSHAKHTFSAEDAAKAAVYGAGSAAPARNFKVHECTKCNIRFPTGQALGGHMRRHYDLTAKRKRAGGADAGESTPRDDDEVEEKKKIKKVAFFDAPLKIEGGGDVKPKEEEEEEVKTVSFSGISEKKERVFLLDLNFPPVECWD